MTETCCGRKPVYDQHGNLMDYGRCDKVVPREEEDAIRLGWRFFGGYWCCPDCKK